MPYRRFKEQFLRTIGNSRRRRSLKLRSRERFFRLDPFQDKGGFIRVGGRLGNSQEFVEDFKHSVILPKKSFIAHAGRGITLNELRSRYWIVNANSAGRHLISNCVACRRLRGTTAEQKMADLREERITSAPPFTYCGVDLLGSFQIRQERSQTLWGTIYVLSQ